MVNIGCSWEEFKQGIGVFAKLPLARRKQIIFRGQRDASLPLQSTLDRGGSFFASDEQRGQFMQELLLEFKRELIGLSNRPGFIEVTSGRALELLARHHGLPSMLLDWTESPYIAASFALEGPLVASSAAVWTLDLAKMDDEMLRVVDIINEPELLKFNARAIEQRAVFTRINTGRDTVDKLLDSAVSKFTIPGGDRRDGLNELDAMGLTAVRLFCDFDGAARTATSRIESMTR